MQAFNSHGFTWETSLAAMCEVANLVEGEHKLMLAAQGHSDPAYMSQAQLQERNDRELEKKYEELNALEANKIKLRYNPASYKSRWGENPQPFHQAGRQYDRSVDNRRSSSRDSRDKRRGSSRGHTPTPRGRLNSMKKDGTSSEEETESENSDEDEDEELCDHNGGCFAVMSPAVLAEIKDMSTIICFNCDKPGHFSRDCKEPRRSLGEKQFPPAGGRKFFRRSAHSNHIRDLGDGIKSAREALFFIKRKHPNDLILEKEGISFLFWLKLAT